MNQSKMEKTVLEVLGDTAAPQLPNEKRAVYLKRLALTLKKIPGVQFDKLPDREADWANAAIEAHVASKPVAEFPDAEPDEEVITPKTEKPAKADKKAIKKGIKEKVAADAKKESKKSRKHTIVKGLSRMQHLYEVVATNGNATEAEVLMILQKRGVVGVTPSTVRTAVNLGRAFMLALKRLGALKSSGGVDISTVVKRKPGRKKGQKNKPKPGAEKKVEKTVKPKIEKVEKPKVAKKAKPVKKVVKKVDKKAVKKVAKKTTKK